jgi:CBS domain-containing protein
MAIADNNLWANGDPDFDEISTNTNPLPGEARLRSVCSEHELKKLDRLQRAQIKYCERSENYIDTYNRPNPLFVQEARKANEAYVFFRESLFEKHPSIDSDQSRGDFDPTPPGYTGEVLGGITMVASAAMGMLDDMHSGYYQDVEAANTLEAVHGMPGKKQTLDLRCVIELWRRKCLPVFSYDHTIEDLQLGMRAIRDAHPLYCEPVFVLESTTTERARALLMGQPHDSALYVKDRQGRLKRIITRTDVGLDAKGKMLNGTFPNTVGQLELAPRSEIITAQMGITLDEAKHLMAGKRSPKRLPILDAEGKVRHTLSNIQCQYAEKIGNYFKDKPVQRNIGVAIGISNKEDMLARIDTAIKEGATFITLETAHAYRRDVIRKFKQDFLPQMEESMSDEEQVAYVREHRKNVRAVIKHIREKAKDRKILIGFGTVTSPEAVRLLAALGVDIVKVGVGGGEQCTTFDASNVGGPPFGYFWRCGKAAAALGIQIMADGGIKSRRRFSLVSSLHGVGLLQMGSWPGYTAEAASPPMYNNGVWERLMYGEASPHKKKLQSKRKGREMDDDDLLVHHSEGQVIHAPLATGQFAYLGGIALGCVQAQASNAAYSDAVTTEECQNAAHIRRITKTSTKVA